MDFPYPVRSSGHRSRQSADFQICSRACANGIASRAASIMWRRRTASCSCILNFGAVQDFLSEVGAQVFGCSQVDFASGEEFRQFYLHTGEAQ